MKNRTRSSLLLAAAAIAAALPAVARPPDTIRVPITLYDHHSDGRNDDFQNCAGIQNPGSVRDTLDADHKPIFRANVNCNERINEWYRPSGGTGAVFNPITNRWSGLVNYQGRPNEWVGTSFNAGYAMADVVIYDSLPFHYDEWTGLYIYENYDFFPLDGKGFGLDPPRNQYGHNYGFTTELHYEFVYVPGLTFEFIGDDDLLLFINKHLALDLGGVQHMRRGYLNVDDVAQACGLQYGQRYTFDVFHAERMTTQCNIKIMTNLIMPPAYVFFYPDSTTPNTTSNPAYGRTDTLVAGDTMMLWARVFDTGFNWLPDSGAGITWQLLDTVGNPPLFTTVGIKNGFTSTRANSNVTVKATYIDPKHPDDPVIKTLQIHIAPGHPHHLSLEQSDNPDPYKDGVVDTVRVSSREVQHDVYAAIRDRFGNFIRMADSASWRTENAGVAGVRKDNLIDGRGIVRRASNDSGVTVLHVSQGSLVPDSALVVVEYMPVAELRQAVTRDHDGSGYLDRIELTFNRSLDPRADFASSHITIQNAGRTLTIDSIGVANNTSADSVIIVYLRQDTTGPMETAWLPTVTIDTIAFGNKPIRNIASTDGAGPVIYRAFYRPGDPENDRDDSILVVFSEPVTWKASAAPGDLYNYFQQQVDYIPEAFNGLTSSDLTTQPGGTVIRMTNAFKVEPADDYLQLRGATTQYLTDQAGNGVPDHSRLCEIESDAEGMRTIAVANPFIPTQTRLPDAVINVTRVNFQYGTTVIVKPFKPLTEAWVAVYDNVGNTIVSKSPMNKDPNSNRYYFAWDGRNRNGRYVGAGAYMAVTSGKNEAGAWLTKKCKIGVK